MKKIIIAAAAFLTIAFTSCEKEEIGGVETQALCGEWITNFIDKNTSDGQVPKWEVDETTGQLLLDEYYGGAEEWAKTLTYNTAANLPTEMWVGDEGAYYKYQVKVKCDLASMTFWTDGWSENIVSGGNAKVSNGKIVYGGAKNKAGKTVDAIEYDIEFDNDPNVGHVYHVQGYRRSGLAGDDN